MPSLIRVVIALQLALIPMSGCEDESLPPPEDRSAARPLPEIDLKHTVRIRADRQIAIPNLEFVIQRDPLGSDLTGLTLLSTRASPDGSRIILGVSEHLASFDRLTKTEIHLGGGRLFDPRANGIFTRLTAYQPKFAALKVSQLTEREARGTISGEFYRFRTAHPGARPDVIRLEAEFVATVVAR